MDSQKVLLPEGFEDLLMEDCSQRRAIEKTLMENFQLGGYKEVRTPTLEFYDLFSNGYSQKNREGMFKIIDQRGRILVLRPDCTIPIGRMVATKLKEFPMPLKLCYLQNVYRIDEEQAGKKREYLQAGIEVFGINSYQGDGEIILTAIENLLALGLEDFQIEIGQTKLIKGLLHNLNPTEEIKQQLYKLMEVKNFRGMDELLDSTGINEDDGKLLRKIARLYGDPKEVLESLKSFALVGEMKDTTEELTKTYGMIEDAGYGKYIAMDLGLVSARDYYTGMIFKGYIKDFGEIICSGGRYNDLMNQFGRSCPAVGFAFILDRIMKALKIQNRC